LLYEMLTATQAFQGDTVSDTLAAVLKTEPDWKLLPSNTPRAVVDLLHRCLQKDPKLRLRDIGEARIAIDHSRHAGDDPAAAPAATAPVSRGRRDAMWAAASVAVAVLAFLGARAFTPTPPSPPVRKFSIDLPVQRGKMINEFSVALSRDGNQLAYVHNDRLWVRRLSSFDAHELAGTEGAEMPFWSPDGEFLGYLSGSELRRIPAEGGKSQIICNVPGGFTGGRQACWTEDGRVLFTTGGGGIFAVNALGGEVKEIVPLQKTEQDYHEVSELPGGRGLLYSPHLRNAGTMSLYLYADGKRKELLTLPGARVWQPRYDPSGHILFRRTPTSSGLWAVPFSLESLSVTGDPFLVEADAAEPCPAADGMLAFRHGGESGRYQLAWVGRSGRVIEAISEVTGRIGQGAVSPDGKRVAATIEESDNMDVWVFDLARGTRTRLTFDSGSDVRPQWTPDGSTVVYFNSSKGYVMSRAADGTGLEQALFPGWTPTMSPDGRFVVYEFDNGIALRPFPVDTTIAPTVVVVGNPDAVQPVVSPDGNYLAYVSNESGRWEVYVTRFPSGEGKWQVSTDGGTWPRWSRRGDRLYYQFNLALSEVDVDLNGGVTLGRPHALFRGDSVGVNLNPSTNFDTSQGDRFVVNVSAGDEAEREMLRIRIVQNWYEEFRNQTAKED